MTPIDYPLCTMNVIYKTCPQIVESGRICPYVESGDKCPDGLSCSHWTPPVECGRSYSFVMPNWRKPIGWTPPDKWVAPPPSWTPGPTVPQPEWSVTHRADSTMPGMTLDESANNDWWRDWLPKESSVDPHTCGCHAAPTIPDAVELSMPPEMSYDQVIESIEFDVWSSEEILNTSVAEVTISDVAKKERNSVYDDRMGVLEDGHRCPTCKGFASDVYESVNDVVDNKCPGHFGHITLPVPIVNDLFKKHVTNILKIFCRSCHRMTYTVEDLVQMGILRVRHENGEEIVETYYEDGRVFRDLCQHLKGGTSNKLRDMTTCPHCCEPQPVYTLLKKKPSALHGIYEVWMRGQRKEEILMSSEDVQGLLASVDKDDAHLLGLRNPTAYIMTVVPVAPIPVRPYAIVSSGSTGNDDLTERYIEVIKIVNKISDAQKEKVDPKTGAVIKKKMDPHSSDFIKMVDAMEIAIRTIYDNHDELAKHSQHGRAHRDIGTRLKGKEGRMRYNLMGKRCDFTARSVIGGDPSLSLSQVGVPLSIAKVLTFPERVTEWNKEELMGLIRAKKANYIVRKNGAKFNLSIIMDKLKPKKFEVLKGDRVERNAVEFPIEPGFVFEPGDVVKRIKTVRIRNKKSGKVQVGQREVKINPFVKKVLKLEDLVKLEVGDIVERHMRDGDLVVFNRQPSLWQNSMLAHRVKVMKVGDTIRMNLSATQGYNADKNQQH